MKQRMEPKSTPFVSCVPMFWIQAVGTRRRAHRSNGREVEDICDAGDGKPLFAAFNLEDF